MVVKRVTAVAPTNMAVVKYWGKRDEELILPLNDSLSVTLTTKAMRAKTTVAISPDFKEDKLWLDGRKQSIDNPRLQNCLREIKNLAKKKHPNNEELKWKIRIVSQNDFPTAAGLASSAAGYACLVFALAKLYNVEEDVSWIARMGSGSACRSMFGGFVQWHAGTADDGSDSFVEQVYPAEHWPELHALILVLNDNRKHISSTTAMRNSVQTSKLLQYRAKYCVPDRIDELRKAVKNKDFSEFAEIMIRDSNQFHAILLDTYPPVRYMTDASHLFAAFVHQFNKCFERTKLAYTFDAGPNPCFFMLEEDVALVLRTFVNTFKYSLTEEKLRGLELDISHVETKDCPAIDIKVDDNYVKYFIHTKVGSGPEVVEDESERFLLENEEPATIC